MNSVFVNPGIYSVLLMLFWKSLRICFFRIYQVYVLGMILQTCFSSNMSKMKASASSRFQTPRNR